MEINLMVVGILFSIALATVGGITALIILVTNYNWDKAKKRHEKEQAAYMAEHPDSYGIGEITRYL